MNLDAKLWHISNINILSWEHWKECRLDCTMYIIKLMFWKDARIQVTFFIHKCVGTLFLF